MALYRKIRIDRIETETADSKTFYLSLPDGPPLTYQAGQFLTFVFFKPAGEVRRSYSISSAPLLKEPLCITVKRLDNGEYSRLLFDKARPGDELTTTGAGGLFTLPGDSHAYREYVFIAAGSGITPVLPLIKTLLYLHPHTRVILIYSNRSVAATIFYDALQSLLALFPQRFSIEFLFSDARRLERARLGKELLATLLREHVRAPFEQVLFYTCGPFDYMRMASITLLEQHVPLQHIKKENFTPLLIDTGTRPPDTHAHGI
ncbi:MAG TPA: FAD-binding oxidoreductase, partial [Chitinophagaceae bacterium]|nr:FAD-binding oxidoreductase [Chitinophagaceae bacterium]